MYISKSHFIFCKNRSPLHNHRGDQKFLTPKSIYNHELGRMVSDSSISCHLVRIIKILQNTVVTSDLPVPCIPRTKTKTTEGNLGKNYLLNEKVKALVFTGKHIKILSHKVVILLLLLTLNQLALNLLFLLLTLNSNLLIQTFGQFSDILNTKSELVFHHKVKLPLLRDRLQISLLILS